MFDALQLMSTAQSNWPYLLLGSVIIYTTSYVVYNIWFHPLAKFPGPLLARCCLLWRMYHSMAGRFHIVIQEQHRKYGPVFRVSPNELGFATAQANKDIYGPGFGGKPFLKTKFYTIYAAAFDSFCIASEQDPVVHNRMKRSLTGLFSNKSLLEQESIVQRCVNGFVEKVGKLGDTEDGLNWKEWAEMISFDIMGEMSFGESFGCIENEKQHHWQQMLSKHLWSVSMLDNLRRYGVLDRIGQVLLPKLLSEARYKHANFSRDKMRARLSRPNKRQDFLVNIVAKVESGEMSREEMAAHASTLVMAGGETVSKFLLATTWHLGKNPDILHKLQDELRTRYKSYEEIDTASTFKLPYLQAVINEGMRIYPPAGQQGLPRLSPGAHVDGYWVPAGTETFTSPWTLTHDEANFKEPYSFIPERWLDADNKDNKDASVPFSYGPRACIGRNFATMEMSLVLAKLHWTYDISLLNPELDLDAESYGFLGTWSQPKVKVRFTKRAGL